MRILVCGSRDWANGDLIWATLDGWSLTSARAGGDHSGRKVRNLIIIEGGQRKWDKEGRFWKGADFHAGRWAKFFAAEHESYPADWSNHGKAAGPMRNQQMLEVCKPELVLAFTNDLSKSKGTRDMVLRAQKAGTRVIVIGER